MKSRWLVAYAATFFAGCTCVKTKIPIHGKLGPYVLETTVDSKIAAYYVENYLSGIRTDSNLDAKLDNLHQKYANIVPNRETLKRLSNEYSVDFASLFWGHQLLSTSNNKLIQERFFEHMRTVDTLKLKVPPIGYTVILVPGLDYKDNGHLTGADLKTQTELLRKAGVKVHFVNISPLGSVEKNATMITEAILAHPNEQLLVGGPSSSGPAIQLGMCQGI